MGYRLLAYKGQRQHTLGGVSILHHKALRVLEKMPRTKGDIIRFPDVFLAFSWQLRLKKRESKALLRELKNLGLIEVIPFHGIRLRRIRKNG